jgi:transcriptional regulator with XRE-family HTH domain
VQSVLDSKKLSLYQVSQQSAKLYRRSSPWFVPHNLYYDLRAGSFTPSIHQISSLSLISGYRVADWLRVFGFDLEDITRLQVLLPSKRTFVLDTSLTDPNDGTLWFANRSSSVSVPSIAPLARLLKVTPAQRIRSLLAPGGRKFVYAKIGTEDTLAFPDLLPGSLVRVNPDMGDRIPQENSPISDRIFLVEHSEGFCCCRIRNLGDGVIALLDNELRYAQVELHCPQEAKLRGTVDFEFRRLMSAKELEVPKDLGRRWKPQILASEETFGQLLRRTRGRQGLSVRDAARMSGTIAELLNDDRYAASASSLSDYELSNTAPRDFHKIVSLCSIYGLHFGSVMERLRIDPGQAGTEAMPDHYLSRLQPAVTTMISDRDIAGTGFVEQLLEKCQDVPFFLRRCLGHFSSSAHVSLEDFFWVGADEAPLHPYLADGLVVLVNRRRKAPLHFLSKPLWQQPIYVVLKRDGTYLAACCGVANGALVVYPYTQSFRRNEEYRLHQDVEVVGQIVAIARRLP